MFGPKTSSAEKTEAEARLRLWTRERFGLSASSAVLVAELRCTVAGCPPLETALAFWTEEGERRQFKILRPVTEVTRDDLDWLIIGRDGGETAYWDCC